MRIVCILLLAAVARANCDWDWRRIDEFMDEIRGLRSDLSAHSKSLNSEITLLRDQISSKTQ